MRAALRILLIPLIAGVAYEFIRLAGRSNNPIIRSLSLPGLMMQQLTTAEPDDEMIKVGIASVEAVFNWKKYLNENFGANYELTEADEPHKSGDLFTIKGDYDNQGSCTESEDKSEGTSGAGL